MTRCIALLRGINVGRAQRIAMAELRALFEALGYADVRSVLNSGNVVFRAPAADLRTLVAALEAAIGSRFGFSVPVVLLTADDLEVIVAENRLPTAGGDPSRHLVAFVNDPAALDRAQALLRQSWAPESLAVGSRAAYLWCPDGIIESRVAQAFSRVTGDAATSRNWATVLKLQVAARGRL